MKKLLLPLVAVTLVSGCAVTTEGTLNAPLAEKPETVCIITNPAVLVEHAEIYLQQAFMARGIEAIICPSLEACKSDWHMTYVMTRRWDLTPYLASGYLELYKNGQRVSAADFSGGWGLNFGKYGHTKRKIDGMVGALLGEKAK